MSDLKAGATIRPGPGVARNSANTGIHSDAFAQRQGFKRAIVAGPNHLSFVATTFERELGPEWLTSGRLNARFTEPVYDGDTLQPVVTVTSDDDVFRANWTLLNAEERIVAKGDAWLGTDTPLPNLARESSPVDELRDLATFAVGERVPDETVSAAWSVVDAYCELNRDPLAREGRVPTAYLTFLLFGPARRWLTGRGVGPGMWGEIAIQQHSPIEPDVTYGYEGRVKALRTRGNLELIDFEFTARSQSGELACAIAHTHIIPHRETE